MTTMQQAGPQYRGRRIRVDEAFEDGTGYVTFLDNGGRAAVTLSEISGAEEVFRVMTYYQTSAPGLHGWHARPALFATREEAEFALRAPLGRGEIKRRLDIREGQSWKPIDKHARRRQ